MVIARVDEPKLVPQILAWKFTPFFRSFLLHGSAKALTLEKEKFVAELHS